MTTLSVHFAQLSWDERDLAGSDAATRIATVEAHMRFTGDVEAATSTQGFILYYDAHGGGHFTGYESLKGTVSGKAGSLVLATTGTFRQDGIAATWTIVDGSGTGDLRGIRGSGSYLLPWGAEETDATLEVAFPTGED